MVAGQGKRNRTACDYCRCRKIKCKSGDKACAACHRAGKPCTTQLPRISFRQTRAPKPWENNVIVLELPPKVCQPDAAPDTPAHAETPEASLQDVIRRRASELSRGEAELLQGIILSTESASHAARCILSKHLGPAGPACFRLIVDAVVAQKLFHEILGSNASTPIHSAFKYFERAKDAFACLSPHHHHWPAALDLLLDDVRISAKLCLKIGIHDH